MITRILNSCTCEGLNNVERLRAARILVHDCILFLELYMYIFFLLRIQENIYRRFYLKFSDF